MNHFILIFMGFFTGLIDSIVGGGGLISLPTLSIAIAPGVQAIGTNKIVGAVGALSALIVYAKKGHLRWKDGLSFSLICAGGSFFGSSMAPYVSKDFFRYLLLIMCPILLFIVWNKEMFFKERKNFIKPHYSLFFLSAFASGFYDGFFGPGGGTFMFLGLFLGTGYPLLPSIAISKMANTFSATTALVNYAHQGYVHWKEGSFMAAGMILGSFIGATYATKNITKIIQPMLTLIVVLLMLKLIVS